jgi:hypothetical protein
VKCVGDLLQKMYPDEDPDQNLKRRDHLLDLYLNMPDKVIYYFVVIFTRYHGPKLSFIDLIFVKAPYRTVL